MEVSVQNFACNFLTEGYFDCILNNLRLCKPLSGPGSSVGIATGYGLDGPGIESRWRRDFPYLSSQALGAQPASCKIGTGSFLGVKSGRVVILTPHPLLVPWSRKSRAIRLHPYGPYDLYRASVPVQGCTLTFSMYMYCLRAGRSGVLIPVEARFSAPVQTGPGGPPSLLYNGYRVFPGGKERPGRNADTHPLLVPWSRKSRATHLLPLWAVRPVQSLSACTRVYFTLTFKPLSTYI